MEALEDGGIDAIVAGASEQVASERSVTRPQPGRIHKQRVGRTDTIGCIASRDIRRFCACIPTSDQVIVREDAIGGAVT